LSKRFCDWEFAQKKGKCNKNACEGKLKTQNPDLILRLKVAALLVRQNVGETCG